MTDKSKHSVYVDKVLAKAKKRIEKSTRIVLPKPKRAKKKKPIKRKI